jgi:hypothetical protein
METHDLFQRSLSLPLVALVVPPLLFMSRILFLLCFNILWDTISKLQLHVLAGFVWTCGRAMRCLYT